MFIDKSNTFLKMNHSSVVFPVHCQAPSAIQVGVTIKFFEPVATCRLIVMNRQFYIY